MADVDTSHKPQDPPANGKGEAANAAEGQAPDVKDVTNADSDVKDANDEEEIQEGAAKSDNVDEKTGRGEGALSGSPGSRESPEGGDGNQQGTTDDLNMGDNSVIASGADATVEKGGAESREVVGGDDAGTDKQDGEVQGAGEGEGQEEVPSEVTGGMARRSTLPEGDSQLASGRTEWTGGLNVDDSARQVEGAEADDGAGKPPADSSAADDDDDDGGEGADARNEGEQPPATPTFSDEEGEGIQKLPEGEGQSQGEGRERTADGAAGEADDTESARSPTLTASAAAQLAKRLTSTPADGLVPKPQTAHLPAIARGQVRAQQMTSAIADAIRNESLPPPRQPIRTRRPPKYIRLATVTVSPAKTRPLPHRPSLYYEEPKRPRKVITWDEAMNARPPLRIDMEGPTPCSYTPRIKPLNETNAPAYTFGSRCQPEKAGGARTSWSKSWFQTPHVWHNKVDFIRDNVWPSPFHYPKPPCLGPRQRTMPEAPSYTFGHKSDYSNVKPGAPNEPSPNEYQRQLADKLVLPRGPAFTHQLRREGTMLWGSAEHTPGPAAYSPNKPSRERPSFTIQGIRREKSHILGPFSAL